MAAVVPENPVIENRYGDRLIGRTAKQKETEQAARDSEREYWIGVFSRMGDGRANRKTPKEERLIYRKVAAMIEQNKIQ